MQLYTGTGDRVRLVDCTLQQSARLALGMFCLLALKRFTYGCQAAVVHEKVHLCSALV